MEKQPQWQAWLENGVIKVTVYGASGKLAGNTNVKVNYGRWCHT